MAHKSDSKPASLNTREAIRLSLVHATLIFFSILFIFPLFWMLNTAIKPIEETLKSPPVWIPSKFLWSNFWDAIVYGQDTLGYMPFVVYAINTFALAILVVCATVGSNAFVAYSFARLRWPGRDIAFSLTLATMMIPFPILMVPTFQLFQALGWVGTFRPLWVPALFGSAFNIYLLTQFFKSIPFELSEAARIDGGSDWTIFTKVILPLAIPALAVVALFSFMGTLNDFMGPLIYLIDQKTFTLSLGLQAFQSQHGGTQWNLLMAATTIVIGPIIILFFFTQRLFIQGIAVTGLKG